MVIPPSPVLVLQPRLSQEDGMTLNLARLLMSFEQLTLITNRSKRNWQYCIRYGCAMQVTAFALGNSGHDPESPVTALTPDPNYDPTPDANNNRYPVDMIAGPLTVTSALDDPYFATIWTCDVVKGVATGVVSSIYLLAQFTWLNPTPIGVPLTYVEKYNYYTNPETSILGMDDGTLVNTESCIVPITAPYTFQLGTSGTPPTPIRTPLIDGSFVVRDIVGTTLTRVTGTPASINQYNVTTAGLISFHAAKAGASISYINYAYAARPAPYFICSMGYFPISVKVDNESWTLSCGVAY